MGPPFPLVRCRRAAGAALLGLLLAGGCGSSSPRPAAVASTGDAVATAVASGGVSSTTDAPPPDPGPTAGPGRATSTSTTTTAVTPVVPGAVVVIDPGHNEHNHEHTAEINRPVDIGNGTKACDTTGTATDDGYSEAAYTTDVAARAQRLLEAQGVTVVLTRDASTPWGPCIDRRAAIGNSNHAAAAVSIHADGGPASGRGFHVIQPGPVPGHNDGIVAPSHQLGLDLRAAFEAATGLPRSTYAGEDGLDTRTDLGGLNLSTVPKVLIETANMRNATDAALLEDPAFRQRVAVGIADGIERFLAGG